MIKKISHFFLLLSSLLFFSQIQVKVLDAENQKPVPYAKLLFKDKDYYRNTEENGEADIQDNEEIKEIQSFGYENLRSEVQSDLFFRTQIYGY